MYAIQDQALYSQLLQSLIDADESGHLCRIGTYRKKSGAFYFHYRAGARSIDENVGPVTPDLEAEIERRREVIALAKQLARDRSRLVRQLRTAGYLTADAKTGAVLNVLALAGAFRLGAILIGTHAYRCYGAMLGRALPDQFALTTDIDITQSRSLAIGAEEGIDLPEVLQEAEEFIPAPTFERTRHAAKYFNRDRSITIDVLTYRTQADDGSLVEVASLGTHAQPLAYQEFLMRDPRQAAVLYRGGILVRVPAPERFALHKLIVSQIRGRRDRDKAAKDLAQARVLIDALAHDRQEDLNDAWLDLLSRGADWSEPARKALRQAPDAAEVIERIED